MEHKYSIVMEVPLGNRYGTLFLSGTDTLIHGILHILGNENGFSGTISSDGELEFSGKFTTLLREIPYHAKGKIVGSTIHLDLIGDRNIFHITGEEVSLDKSGI